MLVHTLILSSCQPILCISRFSKQRTKESMASIATMSSNRHEKLHVTLPPSSRTGCTVALSPSAPKRRLLLISDALLRFSFLHSPE
ncbi:hypothetical protein Hanom_Chr16g01442141 [Helianthus anomalus]